MRAGGGEDVAKLAEALSFPVVLKGEGVAHKTEAGAVVLGLADAGAVQAAARQMAADRVLIEEMITDGVAELLVGVMMDPAHGFLLTLGAGGTLTEIIGDRVSLLLPVTGDEVEVALQRLAYAPVLNGYRGAPAVDTAAIVAAVLAVQDYVIQNRETILEVEINPLITTPTRAVAADALLRVKDET
jgi:succinyl-CoA synthetase beta subunit